MKKIIGLISNFVLMRLRLIELFNHTYDLVLFYKYSFLRRNIKSIDSLRASILKEYHAIEKGLALPKPRVGFGKTRIPTLIEEIELYERTVGQDKIVKSAKDALREYILFNKKCNEDITDPYYQRILMFVGEIEKPVSGGIKMVTKREILATVDIDFYSFAKSRMSTRDFSNETISEIEIERAVEIARNAPSVCNRQAWKVHWYSNKNQIEQLLGYQNGNGGFGHTLQNLIVISTDIKAFTRMEGNQVFIDGGLFSMNFVYALHSLSIGSCCLNTCIPFWFEKKIKKTGDIPSSERVIMMIAIGKLKEEYRTAFSAKRNINQILKIH